MPRSVKKTVQDLSRDMERLLVVPRTRSSDATMISETLTDDQDEEEEEPLATDAGGDHQELCQTRNILEEIPDDVTTVGSPAAPHNSLETSVIDLCDETILSTNNETVSESFQEEDSELVDNIDLSAPEIILIDDDEDESRSVEEVANLLEAQGRGRVDTTIVISESEEEHEHEEEHDESAEGGNLDETLNILTIKCPICLAGFREIQAEGKAAFFVSE